MYKYETKKNQKPKSLVKAGEEDKEVSLSQVRQSEFSNEFMHVTIKVAYG